VEGVSALCQLTVTPWLVGPRPGACVLFYVLLPWTCCHPAPLLCSAALFACQTACQSTAVCQTPTL
jgi:hypothetical protein